MGWSLHMCHQSCLIALLVQFPVESRGSECGGTIPTIHKFKGLALGFSTGLFCVCVRG